MNDHYISPGDSAKVEAAKSNTDEMGVDLAAVEAQEEKEAKAMEKTYEEEQESRVITEPNVLQSLPDATISTKPATSSSGQYHGTALFDVVNDGQMLEASTTSDDKTIVSEIGSLVNSEPIAIEFEDAGAGGEAEGDEEDTSEGGEGDRKRELRQSSRRGLNVHAAGLSSSSSSSLSSLKRHRQRRIRLLNEDRRQINS